MLTNRATELAESFINGNRNHVVDEIINASPATAAYLAAEVMLLLPSCQEQATFRRMLYSNLS